MYVHPLGRSEELQAHRLPLRAPRPVSRSAASHRSEVRVTNAWPSVIEARRNRNALRRRKEHTRGDTDSRPARRQGPLVHGLSGPVTTNSGKGRPVREYAAIVARVAVASCQKQNKPRPQRRVSTSREVSSPGIGSTQPIRENGSTGPRPGDAHPFRRSGPLVS